MSLSSILAAGLRDAANMIDAPSAAGAKPSPIGDIKTAFDAAVVVFLEIRSQKVKLSDSILLANAVQQILVDYGVEPPVILQASKLIEAVAPILLSAYEAGIIRGGVPTAFPAGGGPGPYRGR